MVINLETFKTPPNPGKVNGNPSDADKAKAWEILCSPKALQYMSSVESEGEMSTTNGPKARKIKKIRWERSKLRNIKKRSDEVSTRPRPNGGPSWAIHTN